ncbi:polysaccharide pyruvyl transferase family protein [Planctomycetota bacterium]
MGDTVHILVADYVPLANKGEEAIVRGMADLLGQGRLVRLGVFGLVEQPETVGNITVFPWFWIFRAQGNRSLKGKQRLLHDILLSCQMRLGYLGPVKHLQAPGCRDRQPLVDFFQAADLILVGHDGVFCTESCAVIHLAKRSGKRVGILGASATLAPKARAYKGWLYRRALTESDFCLVREHYAQQSLAAVAADPNTIKVAPDPAFAMQPASRDDVECLLAPYERFQAARQAGRPIIAATVLEAGRVYAGFRPELNGEEKRRAHASYLATIFSTLVEETQALILFLPHSIEQYGNDVQAAQRVVSLMPAAKDSTLILDRDLDARMLKGIVQTCDFLVGQRTHSLIGSVSMATPFIGLTNRADTRTHGIIGVMCECEKQLIDMDTVDTKSTSQRVQTQYAKRAELSTHLQSVRVKLMGELQTAAAVVWG